MVFGKHLIVESLLLEELLRGSEFVDAAAFHYHYLVVV
jgi:hypothetical protein